MLKKILFTTILVVGCSLFAFGQSSDDKKQTPPKPEPPKVDPGKKPAPTPTPTPKKPNLVEVGSEVKFIIKD